MMEWLSQAGALPDFYCGHPGGNMKNRKNKVQSYTTLSPKRPIKLMY